MSWICVGCSEQESDDSEVRGFGLCKACQLKARKEKAAAISLKARQSSFKSKKYGKKYA